MPCIAADFILSPLTHCQSKNVTRKIYQQKEGETGNEASEAWRLIGREYICMAEIISTVHPNSLAVFITMSLSIHHQQLYYLPKC